MKTRSTLALLGSLAAAVFSPTAHAQTPPAQQSQKLNVFYFGNSYLENTMVGFHPVLGKSAGKEWNLLSAIIHPGIPIWVHADAQTDPASADYKNFHARGAQTDAIVMLQFAGPGLSHVTDEMWGKYKFNPPRDIGDIASCATIMREYLKMNPGGRSYVYNGWPSSEKLGEFKKRVEEEQKRSAENRDLDRGEVMKKVKTEVHATDDQIEPILQEFDYAAAWLATDYLPDVPPDDMRARFGQYTKFMRGKDAKLSLAALAKAAAVDEERVKADLAFVKTDIATLQASPNPAQFFTDRFSRGSWYRVHSRPHSYALLEGLKKEFPDEWKQGRLGMIPVGDVMLALHTKILAGQMPPFKSVGQFAPGHMRSGISRYMLGATFYAVLFKDHPSHLDASIYADRENYVSKKPGLNIVNGYYVHIPDLGRHLEITPERKKLVDDTIWEVVNGHPYTGVKVAK